mmetsp:Transcript_24774/g.44513  ORF Transcript_24774/g.44513 Transcript_24774/m.44513 type:complete len:350 (+) Transcript_24774:79-1128(+)|eukprot:CAMPEP_0201888974 /NCGR_PEP_ID=MMETSP0902-20130614/28835_1 /ASSEMBLY_ACC=CAM_ASM_000551 /TAXON_ID=420261 /ORGANISM="Thalassiosira antarctica, Strain CCMP982" /LENGTH=349 /DNA_ID=CAMNT_0048419389 /DNA_START=44 /DNA_END=1093 /DNA_ORIENTATION=-
MGGSTEADFDIASVDGPALTPQISGIVGLCLTSFLWVIASWRLLYHYSGWCSKCCTRPNEEEGINHLRTDGLTTKRILHGLLWTAMTVEGVGYADMVATNSSNKLNYTLLDIIGRGILEFSTFIIGTVHWFNLTSQARAGDKKLAFTLFPVILAIVTIAVTCSSTFEAVVLLNGEYETVHDFRANSKIHRITLLVESAGWGIHAVIVAICGTMVYKRISSLPTFSQVRSQAKRNIITKMIIPMIFCALGYALRSGWMAADFASRILSPDTTFEAGVGWWVGNCWVPTFIPSMMLLYSIRKRDREPGSIDGVRGALLQSPHAEAVGDPFQSFQQTFRDFEDEDASLPSNK